MGEAARFATVTYPHDWSFEIVFWPIALAVVFGLWWMIDFNLPKF